MRQYFYDMVDFLTGKLTGEQVLMANYGGESSDFIRFNRSRVRQAGSVTQRWLSLELIDGPRHAQASVGLCGEAETDRARAERLLASLAEDLPHVPEDPYLLYSTDVQSGEQIGRNELPDAEVALSAILEAGRDRDMVGIHAQGGIFRGFGNSLGQRNWFSTYSFHLDWTFYHESDKAVKASYAGFEWDPPTFSRKVDEAAAQLSILAEPAKTIEPGEYRVYLAPAALKELLGMVSWSGFGLKSHRTKTTCLLKMIEEGAALDESIVLRENTREGLAANFQGEGFIKPDEVTLIDAGQHRDCLVSPRSAKEYDQPCNAGGEYPVSLDLAAGDIHTADVLGRLDTGVYVNTLWYLNYSDRPACRITGMTRFATFWVEGGRIAAPLNVMRFDETIYRALGQNLIGLTAHRDLLPSSQTYHSRGTESTRLPGALIDNFRFTL